MGESDETERSESQLLAERRAKLARLRESGVEPFPHAFEGRTDIAVVRAAHEGSPRATRCTRSRVASGLDGSSV